MGEFPQNITTVKEKIIPQELSLFVKEKKILSDQFLSVVVLRDNLWNQEAGLLEEYSKNKKDIEKQKEISSQLNDLKIKIKNAKQEFLKIEKKIEEFDQKVELLTNIGKN